MIHLFIVNPAARWVKGRVETITNEISEFFKNYQHIRYDIYVTEWCRDAVTYIRRYAMDIRTRSDEIIRVHTIGGAGTLFEVINGIIGLHGMEAAAYPYGRTNIFLKYFKPFGLKPFASIHNQVFGGTVPMDVIRCGNDYGICFGITGLESYCDAKGDEWIEKGMPVDISFALASISAVIKGISQTYRIEIDGQRLDGDYISIFIANTPCYGNNLSPGIEAHPDDGKLEIYLHKTISKAQIFRKTLIYLRGEHEKIDSIMHLSGKRITLSSDKIMCLNIDSETFYRMSIEYELVPGAVQFVCPGEVDLAALPVLYNKPEKGRREKT